MLIHPNQVISIRFQPILSDQSFQWFEFKLFAEYMSRKENIK
jgi:hypothetical protein